MASWEQRFTELTRDRGAALVRYAYLLCGDRTEAADLVQEALLRTFGRGRTGTEVTNIEAYVRRALVAAFVDGRRRQARWRAIRHLIPGPAQVEAAESGVLHRDELLRASAGLSPRQRACLVLRYYEDMSVAQIADQLGCSAGAVKRHLSDALARLAPLLDAATHEQEEGRIP